MPKYEPSFTREEIDSTYCGVEARFVVSLIVGYSEEEGVDTPEEAAAAALRLAQDSQNRTSWYVFDRQTGETTLVEQAGDL